MVVVIGILRLAVLASVVYFAWRMLQPQWAFVIVVDESGLRSHKGITTAQQKRLLELFRRTRFPEGRVRICGRHDSNGRLQLQFYGAVSEETRQQVLNYVANEL